MSIYAILAVELFHDIGPDCVKVNSSDAWMESTRGYCLGDEYFGNFSKSLYTFFQILTGESWSEAVARPVIWYYIHDPLRSVGSGIFFVSYYLFTAVVLTNVVVAVLLEKMVDPEVSNAAQNSANPTKEPVEARVRTDEDLDEAINSIEETVEQLTSLSESMSSEVGSFRNHLATIRSQVTKRTPCKIIECL